MEDKRVKEILPPTGGPWGGTTVNEAFWDLITQVMGDKASFLHRLKRERPKDWLEIDSRFEQAKRVFNPSDHVDRMIASLSNSTVKFYLKSGYNEDGEDIETALTNADMGVSIDDESSLSLTSTAMGKLFEKPLKEIIDCLSTLLDKRELKQVKYMFMVGGFSQSNILQSEMRSRFGDRLMVLVPDDPALAIMKGSILYGLDGRSIYSRIARKTYGLETTTDFDPKVHDITKRIISHGKAKCKNIFKIFIHKGEEVETDREVTYEFSPKHAQSTAISFSILSSDSINITYSDEAGVEELGSIEIPMADVGGGKDKKVKVTMVMGGTEIKVIARDINGGQISNVLINFDTEHRY